MSSIKYITGLFIMFIVSVAISNCAIVDERQKIKQSYPSWPPAPAKAKVKLVNLISVPEDLGIEKSFWKKVGEFFLGDELVGMVRPMAIVTYKNKQIYVADPGAYGVHMFDMSEQEYRLIKLAGNKRMLSPVALAITKKGDVLITDSSEALVYKYHYGDEFASPLNLDEGLEQPTGIVLDDKTEDLYIVDTKRHQVLVYDATGSFNRVIGKRGNGNGEFNYPTMLCWNSAGELLVTDSLNFRVQVFNKHGQYLKQFGQLGDATGYQARPKGIASDNLNNTYIVDSLFNNVQIYDQAGRYLLSVGEQGQAPGKFWLPTGIYINDRQKVYVADSHNQRVQVFELIKARE